MKEGNEKERNEGRKWRKEAKEGNEKERKEGRKELK